MNSSLYSNIQMTEQAQEIKEQSFDDDQKKSMKKDSNIHLIIFIIAVIFVFCLAIIQLAQPKAIEPVKIVNKFQVSLSDNDSSPIIHNIIAANQSSSYREVKDIESHAPIFGGEIHFARIPREYWEHRLQMIKSLGLNTLSVYIFWNFHQISPGIFDFKTGEKDLIGFLQLAAKYQFKVLLRPGPYVCAEWDFGGLPARLLGIKGLVIRSSNALYEAQVFTYFKVLSTLIKPFLKINGGNIILLQIQNEAGSYNRDYQHSLNLLQMWKNLGVQCNFYYEDAYPNWIKHYWPGANIGLSEGHHIDQFTLLERSQFFEKSFVFGGEVYTGWLTHWGQGWNGLPIPEFIDNLKGLLENKKSFSLYLIHGGTNFGLTAGANDDTKYTAHITSYDYDAPINEQGSANKKFDLMRDIMKGYATLENIPKPFKIIQIPNIQLTQTASLLDNLADPINLKQPTFFESDELRMYHQGIVVYETILNTPGTYQLSFLFHDHALIIIDEELQAEVRRKGYQNDTQTVKCKLSKCVLKIMVEAMGHVNYGQLQPRDKKGILFLEVRKGASVVTPQWKAYRVLLNDTSIFKWKEMNPITVGPVLKVGSFELNEVGDTYFDMQKSTKGYVWVNDRLLGRYWNIGPQYRLYCPGVWLKQGKNEVRILEFNRLTPQTISTKATLVPPIEPPLK